METANTMASAGPILRDLIVRFGARAVLASFLREVMARRGMPGVDTLPDHLRRDIGLPPRPPDRAVCQRYF